MTGRTRAIVCGSVVMIAISGSASWKVLFLLGWRMFHGSQSVVAGKTVSVPWRWMITKNDGPILLRTFSTLLPDWDTDYSSIVLEPTSQSDQAETVENWFDKQEMVRRSGYSNFERKVFDSGKVICSLSKKRNFSYAGCRTSSGISLSYVGTPAFMNSALEMLEEPIAKTEK